MVGRSRTINIGWKTTSGTRNLLLADLRFMLSDNLRSIRNGGQALIPDRNWYIEARNFMLNPKGKFEHAKGHHDDRLFAGAIAMQAKKQGYRTIRNLTEIDRKNIEDNSLFLYKDGQIVMNHRALREKVVIKTKKTLYF